MGRELPGGEGRSRDHRACGRYVCSSWTWTSVLPSSASCGGPEGGGCGPRGGRVGGEGGEERSSMDALRMVLRGGLAAVVL
eukprot:2503936-Heterocapsa_arctica.AAC.1